MPHPLQEFVSLAFSGDGRYLAAQGGAPDWALSLWLWEKSKLVASMRTAAAPGHTAVQCSFQPGAPGGRSEGHAVRTLSADLSPLLQYSTQHCLLLTTARTAIVCCPALCYSWVAILCLRPWVLSAAQLTCLRLTACHAGEDPQYICVVGEGTCCLLALEAGNTLRMLPGAQPRREAPCYTSHA